MLSVGARKGRLWSGLACTVCPCSQKAQKSHFVLFVPFVANLTNGQAELAKSTTALCDRCCSCGLGFLCMLVGTLKSDHSPSHHRDQPLAQRTFRPPRCGDVRLARRLAL